MSLSDAEIRALANEAGLGFVHGDLFAFAAAVEREAVRRARAEECETILAARNTISRDRFQKWLKARAAEARSEEGGK